MVPTSIAFFERGGSASRPPKMCTKTFSRYSHFESALRKRGAQAALAHPCRFQSLQAVLPEGLHAAGDSCVE